MASDPDRVAVLADHARLSLTAQQLADLCDAYAHLEAMLARMPAIRPPADEPAHAFLPKPYRGA